MSSATVFGFVTSRIRMVDGVPNSGMPSTPNFTPRICSGTMESASVPVNRERVLGSFKGMASGSMPVAS